MVKKLISISLLLCFIFIGCANNKSAIQQIMRQTNEPAKISAAIYYDVMGIYKDTAIEYIRYKDILNKNNPEASQAAKDMLNKMKVMLDEWSMLDGLVRIAAIKEKSEEFHNLRRQIIFEFADYLDGKK